MSHAKKDSTASAVDMSALDDALGDEVNPSSAGDAKLKTETGGYSIGGAAPEEQDDLYAKESDKKPTTSSSSAIPTLPIRGQGPASGIKSNIAVIRPYNPDADSSSASAAPTAQQANKNLGAPNESTAGKKGDDSPATLSPNSLRSSSPAPSPLPQNNNTKSNTEADPNVDTLASMFPDLSRGTIGDILRAHHGNMEQAANALLSMDHSSAGAGQRQRTAPNAGGGDRAAEDMATQNDEALARALMQQEEEALAVEREHILRRQQQPQQGVAPSGRRGLGNWLGSGNNGAGSPEPERTYDVSNLNYQPRARRTPSQQQQPMQAPPSQQQQGYYAYQQQPRQQYNAPQQQAGPQGGSRLPNEGDVKQWSETFDRYAEVGLAKAASTFSSLKARVNQGLSEVRERRDQQPQGGSAPPNRFQRPTAGGSTAGVHPSQAQSPDLGRRDTYDRDPAPVGDDELAKILARGAQVQENDDGQSRPTIVDRNSGGAFASSKSKPFLERYGSGTGANSRARGAAAGRGAPKSSSNSAASAQGGLSGWDAVGRTGQVPPASKNEDAGGIQIHDNSTSASKTAVATAAGVGVGAGAGAGVAAAASTSNDHDDDSDDLEYQPNPFEDSDNE